ncbi:39S ribosomal protein L37, mitochondrial [Aphelenchoides fujianensis]|nr:39S ribosomal protein L37, mitochondrial [Aphelenchoides fujianensis]
MVQDRELLLMPRFEVPTALKALGVAVHDPNRREFFEEAEREDSQPKDREQDHPLFKVASAFLFEGHRPFADGVEPACALIGALPPRPLARQLDGWSRLERPADEEALFADAILAGERFDPTLEKLPCVHDPVLFWPHKRDRVHGMPVANRNSIIFANLPRRVLLHALRHGQQKGQRVDYDAPFSGFLPADQLGATAPLVVRPQPALVVQSGEPVRPLWSAEEVEATRMERTPDVYPLLPSMNLDHTHVYNKEQLVSRPRVPRLHVNMLLFTKELDQKYLFTHDRGAGRKRDRLRNAANLHAHFRITRSMQIPTVKSRPETSGSPTRVVCTSPLVPLRSLVPHRALVMAEQPNDDPPVNYVNDDSDDDQEEEEEAIEDVDEEEVQLPWEDATNSESGGEELEDPNAAANPNAAESPPPPVDAQGQQDEGNNDAVDGGADIGEPAPKRQRTH